jgi:hypothetical protein
MNNPLVIEQSKKFATRLLSHTNMSDRQKVELAYRQSLGRRPTHDELEQTLGYINEFSATSSMADPRLAAWSSVCHAIFASLDFRYID